MQDSLHRHDSGHEYRALEARLGLAHRARNRQRVKEIHARIKNRRAYSLHEYSSIIVNENEDVFVGDA